ncbi:MAG: hypothetical protein UHN47_09480 [Lachnospiraceae bacterium]|nr:hypothetical protein [Lachnospiraceae bacterium]
MKKIKLFVIGITVIGSLIGCADKNVDVEVTYTDSVVVEETSAVVETTTEEETVTIVETEVAKTESVEEEIDDVTYNTEIIMSFGINQEDAYASADFLDKISFGKIDASQRVEKGGETRYEVTNKEGISYYLVKNEDTIREILNIKGEFIVTIRKVVEDTSVSPITNDTTQETTDAVTGYGGFVLDSPDDDSDDLGWVY